MFQALSPAPMMSEPHNPHTLREMLENAFRRSPYRTLRRLQVEIHDDVLVLKGKLPSFYLKQMAQETLAAQGLETQRYRNDIEVMGPYTSDDAE